MTLPAGFTVRLRDDVRRLDQGRTLLGGSPLRMVRLSPPAVAMLQARSDQLSVRDGRSAALAAALMGADLAVPTSLKAAQEAMTVVIPVKDRGPALDRALESLGGQLPVIVIDDASDDADTIAAIARQHRAQYLRLAKNVGPAGARNAGLGLVRTPLVAFVDSDVEVTTATLTKLAGHFADPEVALVAPRILGRSVSVRPNLIERYDAVSSSLDMGSRSGLVRPGTAIPYVPSACVVGRVSLLPPGFDTSLRAGEDVDLVWRLVATGNRVRYDAAVVAHHESRASLRDWWQRKALYGSSAVPLWERHGVAVAPARIQPGLAVGAGALLMGRRCPAWMGMLIIMIQAMRLKRAVPGHPELAPELLARSVDSALQQEARLLLRHWWPLTTILGFTGWGRRLVMASVAVDAVAALRNGQTDPRMLALRRLDDAAYGAGLWTACLRARSFGALIPRRPPNKQNRSS